MWMTVLVTGYADSFEVRRVISSTFGQFKGVVDVAGVEFYGVAAVATPATVAFVDELTQGTPEV